MEIDDVFKQVGVPDVTFVEPARYFELKQAIKRRGASVIVEGPSGIGKTTAVESALLESSYDDFNLINCRVADEQERVHSIAEEKLPGVWIFDDFHLLELSTKEKLLDNVKIFANERRSDVKYIFVGINNSGKKLIKVAKDLTFRVPRFSLSINKHDQILEVLKKGEDALNIEFADKQNMAHESLGSFQIAQMIAFHTCLLDGIAEKQKTKKQVYVSMDDVRERMLSELDDRWGEQLIGFCRGHNFDSRGRMPYLNLLKEMAFRKAWKIDFHSIEDMDHPERHSIRSIMVPKKGEQSKLHKFLQNSELDFSDFCSYDEIEMKFEIHDPQILYLLRHTNWSEFAKKCGSRRKLTTSKIYDFAFSLTTPSRQFARQVSEAMGERGISVFLDENELPSSLGEVLDGYLEDIFGNKSERIVAFIDEEYSKKIFTFQESQIAQEKLKQGKLFPIITGNVEPTIFDQLFNTGFLKVNAKNNSAQEVERIVEGLLDKLEIQERALQSRLL